MWVLIMLLYYKPYEDPYRVELSFTTYEECVELGRQANKLRLQFSADGIQTVCIMRDPRIPLTGKDA